MAIFARIAASVVAEIITLPADGPQLAELFHPDIVATCVPHTEGVEVGWRYECGTFLPPEPPTEDNLAAAGRAERTARLAACDWRMLEDAAPGDRAAWIAYRAELRAVPQQPGFPADIDWPASPDTALAVPQQI